MHSTIGAELTHGASRTARHEYDGLFAPQQRSSADVARSVRVGRTDVLRGHEPERTRPGSSLHARMFWPRSEAPGYALTASPSARAPSTTLPARWPGTSS